MPSSHTTGQKPRDSTSMEIISSLANAGLRSILATDTLFGNLAAIAQKTINGDFGAIAGVGYTSVAIQAPKVGVSAGARA